VAEPIRTFKSARKNTNTSRKFQPISGRTIHGLLTSKLSIHLKLDMIQQLCNCITGTSEPNKPDRTPGAAPLSLNNFFKNRMFGQDKINSAERERSCRQIVGDAYTRLWDFFWLTIGLISKLCWHLKLFPLKWAPWFFGSTLGRYPEKIHDDHYKFCTDADCETCRSLEPGELDIDDEREIKHDPYGVLSYLKHSHN
jgi:hypothetical protein